MSALHGLRAFLLEGADEPVTPSDCTTPTAPARRGVSAARRPGRAADEASPRRAAVPPSPVGAAPLRLVAAAPTAPREVVLGAPAEALAAGVALAAAHRTAAAARPVSVLAVWAAPVPGGLPAWPAAMRLATRLAGRGLAASATGRLAVVALPEPDDEAAEALRHLLVAGLDLPLVLAVGGARGPALDGLLDRFDGAVLAGLEPALAAVAAVALTVAAREVPAAGPLDRGLARAGLARAARREAVR